MHDTRPSHCRSSGQICFVNSMHESESRWSFHGVASFPRHDSRTRHVDTHRAMNEGLNGLTTQEFTLRPMPGIARLRSPTAYQRSKGLPVAREASNETLRI